MGMVMILLALLIMMEQAHLWREGRRVAGKRRRPFLHCWGIFRFTIIVSITIIIKYLEEEEEVEETQGPWSLPSTPILWRRRHEINECLFSDIFKSNTGFSLCCNAGEQL